MATEPTIEDRLSALEAKTAHDARRIKQLEAKLNLMADLLNIQYALARKNNPEMEVAPFLEPIKSMPVSAEDVARFRRAMAS